MISTANLVAYILTLGHRVRHAFTGQSMYPHIRSGEVVHIEAAAMSQVAIGDIVAYASGRKVVAHRAIKKGKDKKGVFLLLKGDSSRGFDPPVRPEQLLGKVVAIERSGRLLQLDSLWRRPSNLFHAWVSLFGLRRLCRILGKTSKSAVRFLVRRGRIRFPPD